MLKQLDCHQKLGKKLLSHPRGLFVGPEGKTQTDKFFKNKKMHKLFAIVFTLPKHVAHTMAIASQYNFQKAILSNLSKSIKD